MSETAIDSTRLACRYLYSSSGPTTTTGQMRAAPRHTVVLAVDLPFVEAPLLRWLADHPAPGAVVPRVDGVPQPLCARYSADDLAAAARLLAAGHAAMRDLLAAVPVTYADEADWGPHADPDAFTDVDTPDAAARAGLRWPDPR